MTIATASHRLRVSTVTAVAVLGLFGLSACSSGSAPADSEPTSSATSEAEATEDTTEEAPASGATKCTEEQVNTLSAASGVAVPAAGVAAAKASFAPAAVIEGLTTVCVLSFEAGAVSGSYAVLSGGAASLTAAAANATNAGGQITEAAGTFTGSLEDLTIVGVPFTQLTKETAGFENVEDLVVVASTAALG
ncbi:hypothetical protein [Plantibacter sp. ME-Dv--P-095]|uniref:hypothetical protein n=1 Tax=Plantibacter sp. ME-Dv--P-095 TaxID=3040299 RepID=UPI00254C0E34|nr:hypothetical protein [Plantibacter sp. ME-Dv--P-095]